MKSMTREERRYWRRERIKAAVVFLVLLPACWYIIETIT